MYRDHRNAVLFCVLGACAGPSVSNPASTGDKQPSDNRASENDTSENTKIVPVQGDTSLLDIGTWNLEWFGNTSRGAENEAQQLKNIRHIIFNTSMDIWAVQEVTSTQAFDTLLSQLPGHDGFLANSPLVQDGAAYYSDFGNSELKVGIIYNTTAISVQSAKVILTDYDYEFAGRPPVEIQLTASVASAPQTIVMILVHAKAGAKTSAWERRRTGSAALYAYLTETWPEARVIISGDFNDDMDDSISTNKDSPYKNFVDDSTNYTVLTKTLSDANISSMVFYPDIIDHHIVSNEMATLNVSTSTQVFPAAEYLVDYDQTTTDHFPVMVSFDLSRAGQ